MLNILLEEKKRHPAAGVRDYCKLLYQSEFGAGHMVSGADASLERLRAECAACGVGEDAPFTPVGGGLLRLHLRAIPSLGLRLETVNGLFLHACAPRGSVEGLESKLALLRKNASMLGLDENALEAEIAPWRAAGYPAPFALGAIPRPVPSRLPAGASGGAALSGAVSKD